MCYLKNAILLAFHSIIINIRITYRVIQTAGNYILPVIIITFMYVPIIHIPVMHEIIGDYDILVGMLPLMLLCIVLLRTVVTVVEQKNFAELQSKLDHMTGAYNFAGFSTYAADILLNQPNRDTPHNNHVLLSIDVDDFKLVNDQFGYQGANVALMYMTTIMKGCVRQNDIVGRVGGDEFCIILQNCSLNEGKRIANAICKRIALAAPMYNDAPVKTTVSVGVAEILSSNTLPYNVIKDCVDDALKQSKSNGKNKITTYTYDDLSQLV